MGFESIVDIDEAVVEACVARCVSFASLFPHKALNLALNQHSSSHALSYGRLPPAVVDDARSLVSQFCSLTQSAITILHSTP